MFGSVRRRDIRNGHKRTQRSIGCGKAQIVLRDRRCYIDVSSAFRGKGRCTGKWDGATVYSFNEHGKPILRVNRDAWNSSVSSNETGRHLSAHVTRRLAFTIQGYEYDFNRIKNGRRISRVSVCICIRVRIHVHTWYAGKKSTLSLCIFLSLVKRTHSNRTGR